MFCDRPHRTLLGLTAALLATMALAACSGNSSSGSSGGSAVKQDSTGQSGNEASAMRPAPQGSAPRRTTPR